MKLINIPQKPMDHFDTHIYQKKTWARIHEKILVLRVAPSNKILRAFLEMWAFPLKFKEKILVKKKVI